MEYELSAVVVTRSDVSAGGLLLYARSCQRQEPVAAAAAVVAGSNAGSSGVGSSSADSSGAFRGGRSSGGTWWLYNKETVTAVLEATVERLAAADKEANDTPYSLFYRSEPTCYEPSFEPGFDEPRQQRAQHTTRGAAR